MVPEVDEELTTESILAMSFVEGHPIESLEGSARRTRDRAVSLLMELFFRELFEFQLVQTDPNFANYRYCYQSKRLVLLDFGATRAYSREFARSYRKLFRAVVNADRDLAFEAGGAARGQSRRARAGGATPVTRRARGRRRDQLVVCGFLEILSR